MTEPMWLNGDTAALGMDGCGECSNLESNHQANQSESLRLVSLAQEAIASLSDDKYLAVLEQILYDWRSHTLPTCDPLSVS